MFVEQFDTDVFAAQTGTWVKSTDPKYKDQAVLLQAPSSAPPAFRSDKGVALVEENRFYGFGSEFSVPLDVRGSDLVVQYELRLEEGLPCGGAYVKLPRSSPTFSMAKLRDDDGYSIMFGPDKCGMQQKIHFIIQHQSPVTGAWEEKHYNETVSFPLDKKTHLYTLSIQHADESFALFVDGKEVGRGGLLTHLVPPVNPPAEIDDPSDSKPADWEDAEKIADPEAAKPADWYAVVLRCIVISVLGLTD